MINKHGFKGVIYKKHHRKFYSYVMIGREQVICGSSEALREVVKLRDLYIIKNKLDFERYKLQIIKPI